MDTRTACTHNSPGCNSHLPGLTVGRLFISFDFYAIFMLCIQATIQAIPDGLEKSKMAEREELGGGGV